MYEDIDFDAISCTATTKIIELDRKQYYPYFALIEKFCNENNGIISDSALMMQGLSMDINTVDYHIYLPKAYRTARLLIDQMGALGKQGFLYPDTLQLSTSITDVYYVISIVGRRLVHIYNLGAYNHVPMRTLVNTHQCSGFFEKTVECLGAETQLIGLCQQLYRPYSDMSTNTYTELMRYRTLLYKNIRFADFTKFGAGKDRGDRGFIRELDGVIVGDMALNAHGLPSGANRLQIISDRPIEALMGILKKHIKGARYRTHESPLPNDPHLVKWSITDGDKKSVLDIYNSGTYELIPFGMHKGLRIANLMVCERFKALDLFLLRLIANIPNQVVSKAKIEHNIRQLDALHKAIDKTKPIDLFQIDNYYGSFIKSHVMDARLLSRNFGVYSPP